MKLIRGNGRDASDDEVRATLAAHYAPPSDEGYWVRLERRVMAHILAEGAATREWWSYFPGWTRLGIAAGIAAALVAGVAAWRSEQERDRVAYEELLGAPSDSPILTETLGNEPNADTREATLRYLLSR